MSKPLLQPHHLADLRASGLTDVTIRAAGLYSADAIEAQRLGFGKAGPGLVFPYPSHNGAVPFCRLKPDVPRTDKDGRTAKYLTVKGAGNRLYIPSTLHREVLADSEHPLLITEGEKKALKAVQEGLYCVALAGVWCWRGKGADGEGGPIPDLDCIIWRDQPAGVIFDSDAASKPEVQAAEKALAAELRRRGAVVKVVRLPSGERGEKMGLDDFLIAHGPEALTKLLAKSEESTPSQERPTARRVADVEPEEVHWLWWPRIPLRHLTTLEGDPGEGKSFLSGAIATAVSLGQGLPGMDHTSPANVLLLAAEDHAGCTVRPRLEALGADLERVFCCTDGFTLDAVGLEILEGLLKETLPRLVVLDPLTAYLPSNLDLHRANEVRAPLKALATLAERYDCAVLIIRHLAKGSTSKAIYRGLGSIDITAAARSALLAGHDPDNRDSRAVVQIKSNLGPLADGVGYNIEMGRFAWTGTTGLTAGQLLAPEVEDGAMSEARRFLREMLSEGAKAAGEVEEEAKAAGISSATLRRAKKALGIKVAKLGFQGAYHWSLPIEEGVL